MKRKSMEWEKIFANEVTDMGLASKIYRQLMQFNIKNNEKSNSKNRSSAYFRLKTYRLPINT